MTGRPMQHRHEGGQHGVSRFASPAVISALLAGVALVAIIAGLIELRQGSWQLFALSVAAAPTLLLAAWIERRGRRGGREGAMLTILLVLGLITPEPFLTQQFTITLFIVPVLAAMLLGPSWIIGSSALAMALLILRGGRQSMYLDPVALILFSLVVGGIALGRYLADQAVRRAEESEARYRLITESIGDYLTLIDAQGLIVYASPSFRLIGYEPQVLVGQPAFAAVHPDDMAAVLVAWEQVGRGERALVSFRFRSANGGWRWFDATGTPFVWHGQQVGLIVGRDVTERMAAEAEGQRLQGQLLRTQQMDSIGRLAGGMAHDINNLLTVIIGHADMGRRLAGEGSPAYDDFVAILQTGERAAGLTQRVLAFAQRQLLAPSTVSLNSLLLETTGLLRRLIGEHIELVVLPAEELGPIKADPLQIEQVLINLAVNARDAMPHGGLLTIGTQLLELAAQEGPPALPAGSYAQLTVSDTGAGMPPEVLAHAFEPFFTTKAQGQGTGLGLATTYGIVTQHGGMISVESAVGGGTTFRIVLPCDREVQPVAAAAQQAAGAGGHERLLVVEDEPQVRALAVRVLRRYGYTVAEATNGDEALRLLTAEPPLLVDLVVTDLVMPLMGGATLAEQAGRLFPTLPFLFISGYSDADSMPRAGTILPKPFTPTELARAVRAMLDSPPLQP